MLNISKVRLLFLFLLSIVAIEILTIELRADFVVKTTKVVNLPKDLKIFAKTIEEEGDSKNKAKTLEGLIYAKPSGVDDNIAIEIQWTTISDGKTKTSINMSSKALITKKIIPTGTQFVVQGMMPMAMATKEDKKEKEEKRQPSLGAGRTENKYSTGTNVASPITSPVEPTPPKEITLPPKPPVVLKTFEGCLHVFNPDKENIDIYQMSYYFDDNGNKVIVEDCYPVKTKPAKFEICEPIDDFVAKKSYKRRQAIFEEDGQEYSAGGCMVQKVYLHEIDYSMCPSVAVGGTAIRQGRWFYYLENGEKKYISGCILDPNKESMDLKVAFEGCAVNHDVEANNSVHLGKYYWIKPDNTYEYLGDCVMTNESNFRHNMRWENEKWQHNEFNSQRILTRYINIESENREIIINNKELEKATHPHNSTFKKWVHYDQNNYSTKYFLYFVLYDNKEYFVKEKEDVDQKIIHQEKTERSSGKASGYDLYYKRWGYYWGIKTYNIRPDNTIYNINYNYQWESGHKMWHTYPNSYIYTYKEIYDGFTNWARPWSIDNTW